VALHRAANRTLPRQPEHSTAARLRLPTPLTARQLVGAGCVPGRACARAPARISDGFADRGSSIQFAIMRLGGQARTRREERATGP